MGWTRKSSLFSITIKQVFTFVLAQELVYPEIELYQVVSGKTSMLLLCLHFVTCKNSHERFTSFGVAVIETVPESASGLQG